MSGAAGVLLAFDFGLRRIGIATGNLLTRTASPLGALKCGSDVPWGELDRLVAEWRPDRLVVGLPADEASEIRTRARAFMTAAERRYALPVAGIDESLTSRAAHSQLKEGRRSGYLRRRVVKGDVDTRAACLIAEQWMNEHGDAR